MPTHMARWHETGYICTHDMQVGKSGHINTHGMLAGESGHKLSAYPLDECFWDIVGLCFSDILCNVVVMLCYCMKRLSVGQFQ